MRPELPRVQSKTATTNTLAYLKIVAMLLFSLIESLDVSVRELRMIVYVCAHPPACPVYCRLRTVKIQPSVVSVELKRKIVISTFRRVKNRNGKRSACEFVVPAFFSLHHLCNIKRL